MSNSGGSGTSTLDTEKNMPNKATSGSKAKSNQRKPWSNPRVMAIIGVLFIAITALGIKHWITASQYVSTDNAYLKSDVVQLAPQVSGAVTNVLVNDNQYVNKGDLIATLDDSQYRVAVAQKQADLDAAIAQAKGAGVNVELTSEQGNAQMVQAEGGVDQASSGIVGAKAEVDRSGAAVKNAVATAGIYEANVGAADSAVSVAIANKKRYQEAENAARAQLESAKSSVKTAEANVDAAEANYEKASNDADRYASLTAQGASSKQRLEEAKAALRGANAQLESARQQVLSTKSAVVQKQADLSAAHEQLEGADAAISQAKSQLAATKAQFAASKEGVHQAEAQHNIALQSVQQAEAKKQQAMGQLSQAKTAPRQVGMSMSAKEQAKAKVEQAKAALDAAKLQLSYTRIYAPVSGRISKKSVEVGALVQPGSPLMALVVSGNPWIEANFKETQLVGLKQGCTAEIEVDALPGQVFKAKLESISSATGSTFALLPTDNATGNFTKVVQRITVKLVLDPNQKGTDRLRAGMSVVAKVKKR